MGDSKRYGAGYVDKWIDGWVMREEPMMLTAAELDLDRNPSHDFPEPRRVYAWIRYPSRAIQVKAHAVAWTRTAVKIRFVEPKVQTQREGWVWTNAVKLATTGRQKTTDDQTQIT
ncbi:hypothetical protein [Arthrobacter sp. HLT1-21]